MSKRIVGVLTLDQTMNEIEKLYGKGTIFKYGDGIDIRDIKAIPSSSIGLNIASGIGGYPTGKVVEIYGAESSGKTTMALDAIANSQKNGGKCAFIDAEHAIDIKYAAKLGVKINDLYFSQPDFGEQALTIAEKLVMTHKFDLVVIDSVAALIPRSEMEGEMGDPQMGVQARMMSQGLRRLTPLVGKSPTCMMFINQTRSKIGVSWGNPETTSGGNALKFYASQRLKVSRIATIKDSTGREISNTTKVRFVKNKCGAPYIEAQFDIRFGEGIDYIGEFIDMASDTKIGLIKKSGAWYVINDNRFQGKENLRNALIKSPKYFDKLKMKMIGG